ncbi:glycogen debranching protein [Prochlorococcus sp. MIT 1201]|uniref:glycogen debranching protein n=1 Tax=Prochlorococcus sp. MIT 1201 TaxID=3082535 RepID=UPI0039A539C7
MHLGTPWPLGSTITTRGVNFSVAAPTAKRVELLLFADANATQPEHILELQPCHRSGDYWHVEVEGLQTGCCYGYRIFGPHNPDSNSFHPSKVLLDPCTRAISGWDIYQREQAKGSSPNIQACLKGVVCEREHFDFASHPRPRTPWNRSVIYELHVGGFSSGTKSEVTPQRQGTFLGLIDKLPYLRKLGITAIELLPIFAFDPSDAPTGRDNYWGYSPLNWFTPHPKYVHGDDPLQARQQVRELVAACHDEGIEVILDVVYNHTTEGSLDGPTLSWRGFSDALYYHQNDSGEYLDVSGCGNSIAANRPIVRQLILESMRCWAIELGVDGFRFDLGIALSRGEGLKPLEHPPLFEEIEADPELSDLKLLSEPWDCGGLYRLSDFPAQRIGTWNGHYRDDLRAFWKGDEDSAWRMGQRLSGNADLYKGEPAPLGRSLNFITAHDGFTLNDLVSFNRKHNLANGESNRDGENHNNSWNNGIEGPCSDHAVQALRHRQMRNLIATLLLSRGVPMLLMGDEVGRSQGGNNNSWCQDNPLGWMLWNPEQCDMDLHLFVSRLLMIRHQLSELFSPINHPPEEMPVRLQQSPDDLWLQWHGVEIDKPDWGSWSHTICYSLNRGFSGAVMWMGFNAYSKAMHFDLPEPTSAWHRILDTARPSPDDLPARPNAWTSEDIDLQNRSMLILLAEEYASKLKL